MENLIRIRKMSKAFGEKHVLHDVDLDLGECEILGLLGPSGCGKTTVLRIVAGLTTSDSGSVVVLGRDLAQNSLDRDTRGILGKELGVVFQGGALFDSLTVEENLAFPLRYCLGQRNSPEVRQRVADALCAVELDGTGSLYPAELSGGMKKRAAIARALIYRPRVLLMDEPTTGLDPQTARNIDRLVHDLAKHARMSVLVVTHDLISALGICDRLSLIDEGHVVWTGTASEWEKTMDSAVLRFARGMVSIGKEVIPHENRD